MQNYMCSVKEATRGNTIPIFPAHTIFNLATQKFLNYDMWQNLTMTLWYLDEFEAGHN